MFETNEIEFLTLEDQITVIHETMMLKKSDLTKQIWFETIYEDPLG